MEVELLPNHFKTTTMMDKTHRVGACEAAFALEVVHAVLLEQVLDSTGQRAHRFALGALHLAHVKLEARDLRREGKRRGDRRRKISMSQRQKE